jgi:hypothetical protein
MSSWGQKSGFGEPVQPWTEPLKNACPSTEVLQTSKPHKNQTNESQELRKRFSWLWRNILDTHDPPVNKESLFSNETI